MVHSSWAIDLALLILRATIGFVMVAHGYNHFFGGGKIKGTAGWFESLGMKPGIAHAVMASVTEIGAGILLMLGLLTPLAATGVVGVMFVALVTNHLRNGFFIFRPGEGYEYVLTLILASIALGTLGAGRWSIDHAAGFFTNPAVNLAIATIPGLVGGAVLMLVFWRPVKKTQP